MIEGIAHMRSLRCLFLQSNAIARVSGLATLAVPPAPRRAPCRIAPRPEPPPAPPPLPDAPDAEPLRQPAHKDREPRAAGPPPPRPLPPPAPAPGAPDQTRQGCAPCARASAKAGPSGSSPHTHTEAGPP